MTRAVYWHLGLSIGLSLAGGPASAQTDDDIPQKPASPRAARPARATAEDEALWKRLDITEDGWLDGTELEGGWAKYDSDNDGEVTRAEFMAGRTRERRSAAGSPEDDARQFHQLDVSGNGYLSGTELDQGNAKSFDADNDHRVTLSEYLAGRARERKAAPAAPRTRRSVARSVARPAPAKQLPAGRVSIGKVDQPAPARLSSGTPVGLFFMTRFWSFTGTLEKAAWYFAPDGRVYQNLEHGFSARDLAAHRGPKGTYRVTGNLMLVTWSDGKVTKSKIERDGSAFTWDMGIFTPVRPFSAAHSVAGTYEGGESLSLGGNHAAVSKTLHLRADGTFVWEGVSFVRTTSSESDLSAGGQGATTGSWQISGFSLILADRNGSVLRRIAFPYDDEKTRIYPDRLFFGGTMYKRQ